MKTHTFSIVVGTGACNYRCPYCVSKMTCRAAKEHKVNWKRFDIACRIAEQARDGLVNAMFTGTGEPTLFKEDITKMLDWMNRRFPLVTLQTNGSLLTPEDLKQWADRGLTGVCISIAHMYAKQSNEIMCANEKYKDFNFWECARMIHDAGLMVRLNCTMLREGVHTPEHVEELIRMCLEEGIEQLTLREVDRPGQLTTNEIFEYVDREKPTGAAEKLFHYLSMQGAHRLPDLPHGGVVFDYLDQNVCISNCLTDTLDPNDIRQIIFFPTGEISYDWKYKGARIL